MTGLLPLFLLWAWRQGSQSTPASTVIPSAGPAWPTQASPPPPISAFTPVPTPTPQPPSADTGTPLAELAHPVLPPPAAPTPKRRKGKRPKRSLASRATSAARSKALRGRLSTSPPTLASSMKASVRELQQILNRRGARLKEDGLYGPNTAKAWQRAARAKRQIITISRVSPTIAKVVTKTYDALKMPPIP